MSDYTLRKLNHDEFHLLIPLMEDCFGMSVNIRYFEWKFIKNPAGFVEGFIALSAQGEVAAYYGVIPEIYMIEGKETIIYQSCDTMTHSNHRRKGLFQKLALHCFENLRIENKLFIIGFGGGQSTPGFLKFGWQQVFRTRIYFYPKALSFIRSSSGKYVEEVTDYALLEKLLLQSNDSVPLHSHKTVKLFSWRIANPLYNYKVIAHKTANGSYDSYLCYYITADNKIFLFDFYFGSSKGRKALLGDLKKQLTKYNYKAIISFIQENSYYSTELKKSGFISNPFKKGPLVEKIPFIFFATEAEMTKYNDPVKWQVNSYDHDAM